MNKYSKIPYQWFQLQNRPAYFITYFGDIYFGSLWECPGYDSGFFIVQNDKRRKAIDLAPDERTPEKFREVGWEIRDYRTIKKILNGNESFRHSPVKPLHFSGQQFNQMYVFGAAASTFCVFGDRARVFRQAEYNPPTGFEIFDDKYKPFFEKYPAALMSISEFESKNRDIEGCLDEEWCAYKDTYTPEIPARHINIQFYLQELFHCLSEEVINKEYRYNLFNLFCKNLQKQLSKQPDQVATLVSFNYDTILDHSIGLFSSPFGTMNDYFDWHHRNMILFKPHGSCNWGWKFGKNNIGNRSTPQLVKDLWDEKIEPWQIYYELIGNLTETVEYGSWGVESGNNIHDNGRYSLNKNLIEIIPKNSSAPYLPALLLPYRDKDEFVLPYQQQFALTSCLDQIKGLFLIGWKGNEALFNRKLKAHAHNLRKITIVNPNPDEVKQNLVKAGIDLSRFETVEVKDFETFVLQRMN
ncbi:MAG: hypothetical protein ACOYXT_13815 [Bacteroidota bacterium]